MMTLFDILNQAQSGKALEQVAQQFRLNQEQTQAAMDAILPAFSEGMKRNAQDPMGAMRTMQAMAQSQGGKYFDDALAAMEPGGIQDGNQILGNLFGSKDVSRALAKQAEATTGLGQEIIKQLLPVIASMLMGGMFKQSTGQLGQAQAGSSGNIFAEMMGQMMQGGVGGPMSQQPSTGSNPFQDMMEQMMGAGSGKANNPMTNNPFGQIMEQMMGGGETGHNPSQPASNPYGDMLEQMFDTGRTVQDDYRRNVESIFDQYLNNMKRGA